MAAQLPIADNVRRLRVSRGLSQQQVAVQAGISRVAYGSIERGQTKEPKVGTLRRIARVLDVGLAELVMEPRRLTTARFRSQKRMTAKELAQRSQILTDVARWLKDFAELQDILGERPSAIFESLAAMVSSQDLCSRPPAAAAAVRDQLGLPPAEPIADICRLLESADVKVYSLPLDHPRFFGLSVAAEDGGPAIVVNTDRSVTVERQIFTAAHEFGHLLLHPGAYDVDELAEDRSEESEADAFAGHLLMPQEAFDEEWQGTYGLETYTRVLHTKRIFRVSYGTILRRLEENGLASSSVWPWFKSEHRRRTGKALGKRDEPAALEPSDFAEDLLGTMVRQALGEDRISHSRGAEVLGLSSAEMRQRVVSWGYAR